MQCFFLDLVEKSITVSVQHVKDDSLFLGIFNRVPDTGLEEELKNISHLKKFNHNQDLQRTHVNGYGLHSSVANSDSAALSKNNNGDMEESGQDMEEEEDDEEDETQEEEDQRRWKGIEAIFEAYHEHVNGKSCRVKMINYVFFQISRIPTLDYKKHKQHFFKFISVTLLCHSDIL